LPADYPIIRNSQQLKEFYIPLSLMG